MKIISIIDKVRAPGRIEFREGLGLEQNGDVRLPRLELRALAVVHVPAVLELILGEVLATEVVDAVRLRLAVVGVHLRRQGCRPAQMVVPDMLTRRAGLEIHEIHALRANCDLRLRPHLIQRDAIRHGRFSFLFGMCGRADIARLLRYCKYSILLVRSQAKQKTSISAVSYVKSYEFYD